MSSGAQGLSVKDDFWRAPWEFAVHALVGTCVFAIIAAAAILLGLAVHKLEESGGIAIVITFGLKAAEYALFLSDLVLFAVFLWRASKRTIQNL